MSTNIEFLGIGVQKAATSWLWRNLQAHPEIWMPPRKELHYFDRHIKYPSSNHLADTYLIPRILGFKPKNKQFRQFFKAELLEARESNNPERVRWTLRYYLGTYNIAWYRSLFEEGEGKIKGEITPSYSYLNKDDIEIIKQAFPDIKTFIIFRNPIERAWSNVRYAWTVGDLPDINNLHAIKKFLDTPAQKLRSHYIRMLNNWTPFFDADHFKIFYYDDVVATPNKFMEEILEYLGAENTEYQDSKKISTKINVSEALDIPYEIEQFLIERYLPSLEELAKRIDGHASQWFDDAVSKQAKRKASAN